MMSRVRGKQSTIAACVALLYFAFLTKTYYWDGVLFSLNIESVFDGRAPVVALFHPNHLVYNAFGFGIFRLISLLWPGVRAITVLQVANVLLSIAAGGVLFLIARRLTASGATAVFCWILFAAGATWWKFSTDANAYIISVLLVLLCAWMLLRSRPLVWQAVVCHAAAMLFHELAVFLYIPVLVFFFGLKRLWTAVAYCALTAGIVASGYWLCYEQADHGRFPTLLSWITSFASDSSFTHSLADVFRYYLLSYLKLFAGGKASLVLQFFSPAVVIGFAVCVGLIVWAVRVFKQAREDDKPQNPMASRTVFLWAWLIGYGAFFAVWDPGSAFHKLFVWPAIVLLIGAFVSRTHHVRAYTALAGALAAWNFAAFVYPHSRSTSDPVLVLAKRVNAELPRHATVYYRALSPDDWYLEYFAPGRNWKPLPVASGTSGPVCLETTALEGFRGAVDPKLKWDLVNGAHHVRLECLANAAR
jgi:hypothetical protein